MIYLAPNSYLIESVEELPNFVGVEELFLDVETTHFGRRPKDMATNPWIGDRICGLSVAVDDEPTVFYIPMRHKVSRNLPLEASKRWLKDVIGSAKKWINHNIKFDAHFALADGAEFTGSLVDTLTLAKIYDSDRQGYGLKVLGRDWLGCHTEEEKRLKAYLQGVKSKDFGDAPSDILGEYANEDVRMNRMLYRFLMKDFPIDQKELIETEIKLTSVLFDMEREGLRIDPTEVKVQLVKRLRRQIEVSERLSHLAKREFTNSAQCIQDILINQFGLPILAWAEKKDEDGRATTGGPSFDKNSLALYSVHPRVIEDQRLVEILGLIKEYRDHAYHCGHFTSWLELMDENYHVHPLYNQVVRTGRMSTTEPNFQGINKYERSLIHPEDGLGFISCDYSQIEFRLIVHYIQDHNAIEAYNLDPKTDFHQWTADFIHIGRKAGKTLNFAIGYGAGKKKVTSSLKVNPDIIAEVGDIVNKMAEAGEIKDEDKNSVFSLLCEKRANEVYNAYHEAFPGLQRTAKAAQDVCKRRGFVFNAYGRRRHLPAKAARKAFNAIVQGCAMDIMKERMVALSPRFNERTRELGIKLRINVHDEIDFSAPIEVIHDQEVRGYLLDTLQTPSKQFSIPIRCGMGISEKDWGESSGEVKFIHPGGKETGCLIDFKTEVVLTA